MKQWSLAGGAKVHSQDSLPLQRYLSFYRLQEYIFREVIEHYTNVNISASRARVESEEINKKSLEEPLCFRSFS